MLLLKSDSGDMPSQQITEFVASFNPVQLQLVRMLLVLIGAGLFWLVELFVTMPKDFLTSVYKCSWSFLALLPAVPPPPVYGGTLPKFLWPSESSSSPHPYPPRSFSPAKEPSSRDTLALSLLREPKHGKKYETVALKRRTIIKLLFLEKVANSYVFDSPATHCYYFQ